MTKPSPAGITHCPGCGTKLAENATAKYCQPTCRQIAWRRKSLARLAAKIETEVTRRVTKETERHRQQMLAGLHDTLTQPYERAQHALTQIDTAMHQPHDRHPPAVELHRHIQTDIAPLLATVAQLLERDPPGDGASDSSQATTTINRPETTNP